MLNFDDSIRISKLLITILGCACVDRTAILNKVNTIGNCIDPTTDFFQGNPFCFVDRSASCLDLALLVVYDGIMGDVPMYASAEACKGTTDPLGNIKLPILYFCTFY